MQKTINVLLALTKWPVAIGMILMTIPAFRANIYILYYGLTPQLLGWFFMPLAAVVLMGLIRPGIGNSRAAILMHEVTHMIFAFLTGNKPRDIQVRRDRGLFLFNGPGNWLIAVGPYFFPTIPFILMGIGTLYPMAGQPIPNVYLGLVGVATGFYLISVMNEIHIDQSDFRTIGYLFSILFLPAANLIMIGFILGYACYGLSGISIYVRELIRQVGIYTG